VKIVGEAGRTITLNSPGYPSSRGHVSLDNDVTVIYHIIAQNHFVEFIVFITDDWTMTDNMCLTVRTSFTLP